MGQQFHPVLQPLRGKRKLIPIGGTGRMAESAESVVRVAIMVYGASKPRKPDSRVEARHSLHAAEFGPGCCGARRGIRPADSLPSSAVVLRRNSRSRGREGRAAASAGTPHRCPGRCGVRPSSGRGKSRCARRIRRCHAAPVNREQISAIAHAEHPIKSPLDDDSVRRLLERCLPRGTERVLDLGCGGGEWLLRALAMHPLLQAEGVDISEGALAQARQDAVRLGVQERLVLHQREADRLRLPAPVRPGAQRRRRARLRRPAAHPGSGTQAPGPWRPRPDR